MPQIDASVFCGMMHSFSLLLFGLAAFLGYVAPTIYVELNDRSAVLYAQLILRSITAFMSEVAGYLYSNISSMILGCKVQQACVLSARQISHVNSV